MTTARETPAPDADISARAAFLGVTLLTVIALALRLFGVGFMLPHFAHIDERVYSAQLDLFHGLERMEGETDNYAFYPELVPWVCSITTPSPESRAGERTLAQHRAAGSAKILSLRVTVAWLSALLVPAVYCLARRFRSRRVALTAAALAGLCVLHLWHSQQARPHAVLATTTIAAVLAALLVVRRGDLRAYMLAGLACGLAVATLQSGLAALPALFAGHILRPRERGWRAHGYLLVALAICAVSARVFYPFVFDPGTGRIGLGWWQAGRKLELSGHGVQLSEFNGSGFAPVLSALRDFDPLIGVLFAIGAITCTANLLRTRLQLDERGRDLLVVLAHALPYFLMIGMWQRSYQRFLLPLLPYIALLAAVGVWWLVDRCFRRRAWTAVIVGGILCAQAFTALDVVMLRRAPDTATAAADWISANLERTDRIALVPLLELPLMRADRGLAQHATATGREYKSWARYQAALPADERARHAFDVFNMPVHDPRLVQLLLSDPPAYVRELNADYAVVQEFGPEIRLNLSKVRDAVRASGTLVARFSPWRNDRYGDTPILYYWDSEFAAESNLMWRALAMHSLGAPVEIYKLR
ncbi:MAG: glycosyltransferase family 39 protein [Planctomycetes bacterium]|nr:glycosyltransferase family 39 protein [Planctomycetota bacterium]